MANRFERAIDGLAGNTSRRGFLARAGGALIGASAGGAIGRALKPSNAEGYYGFCGHTYTTHRCPHPGDLPRIDARGLPLRAGDGHPIDNLGRPVNKHGSPVDRRGVALKDPDGRPLPPAPRTRICDEVGKQFGFKTHNDGSWYRCCDGHVRKLVDCCSQNDKRINGDEALTCYCYHGRKVFCVQYFQTKVPC
ncbi:hypothetical protein BH10ACT11_BH10ACT11_01540 [soil metagenome]